MNGDPSDPLHALEDVRSALRNLLDRCPWPELNRQVTAYLLDAPLPTVAVLPLAACATVGGNPRRAAVAASAGLLLILSTRWLDDLADRDRQESLHGLIGADRAMTLAAGALTLAWKQLVADRAVPRDLLQRFGEATLEVGAGQDRDLLGGEIGVEQAWEIMRGKTAAGYAFLLESGAWMAGAPAAERTTLARAGEHLGVAIQLLDDLDGVLATQGRGDLVGRKLNNLLLVHGLSGPHRDEVRRLLATGDTLRLRKLLLDTGAAHAVLGAAVQERDLALQTLAELSERPEVLTARAGRKRLINFARGIFSQLPDQLWRSSEQTMRARFSDSRQV